MPNLPPPGVAGMTLPPQYMMGNPSFPMAYGLHHQQPAAMYSAYGGLEDLAALQRNAAVGLHSLVGAAAAAAQQPAGQQGNQSQSSKSAAVTLGRMGPRRPRFLA